MIQRLYNIVRDPGETADLAPQLPELFRSMRLAYDNYVRATGVLPMPENYALGRQVMVNTLLFYYLPRYLPWLVVALLLAFAVWRYRRRRVGGR